jgi:hypothetical protein
MSKMQNAFAGVIILFILAIPLIGYQAFVVVPREKLLADERQAAALIEARRIDAERKIQQYDRCISSAWENYSANWDQMCELENLEKDCSLTGYLAEGLDNRHEEAKDRCVALYK